MLGGLVFCGVSELAVLGDLQPGWGGRGWGGQAVPRGCQRHTRVCWTQGGKLPLLRWELRVQGTGEAVQQNLINPNPRGLEFFHNLNKNWA